MSDARKRTIKLNPTEGGYARDSWFGLGPFKAKINETDKSLTIQVADQEPEIVAAQEGKFGDYFTINFLDSKAFVDEYESKGYGTYIRIKLFEEVTLPEDVQAKMAGPKGKGGAGNVATDLPKKKKASTDASSFFS